MEETLELYEKMIATQPGVERKGKANPYTSMNGNMFSFLTKEGDLALRLPVELLEKTIAKYKTDRVVSHGTVMKEYAEVPARILSRAREINALFAKSVEYASSLKPKATTRKKAAAKKKTAKKKVVKKKATRKR